MGSDTDVELPNGKIVKGRAYRWGTVEGKELFYFFCLLRAL